ncbi:hypothetical protein M9H77_13536 [Catharanthus roseus]|uniref:Uncharacterized protein n=1 Tax=Catharanthus roseus TaxID=4058 RepID=A0ACC0BKP2_CATRO|nr:hypothetical protein M9H77_13536 [Catharanthus roseus]
MFLNSEIIMVMGNTPSSTISNNHRQTTAAELEPPSPQPPAATPPPQPTENFTCEICIEPMLLRNKLFNNDGKCGHPFCSDCMIKYIQAKLEDNTAVIPCPALNCGQFLEPLTCRELIGEELFIRWCDVLCERALMCFPQSYCPNRNCSALIVNECGGNLKKELCPNCKRLFCFNCKVTWHAGFRCEESGETRDLNDLAFGWLAEQRKWIRCPQCHHFVERINGCQIVRCRCETTFCYKCGQKANAVQHWGYCDGDDHLSCRCRNWWPLLLFVSFVWITICLLMVLIG